MCVHSGVPNLRANQNKPVLPIYFLATFPQIECRVGLGTDAIKRGTPIDRSISPFSIVVVFFSQSIISLLSLPRSKSDPGSPSRLFSLLPTTVRASVFMARRLQSFPRRLASPYGRS